MNNITKYKADIKALVKLSEDMIVDLASSNDTAKAQLSDRQKKDVTKVKGSFRNNYQRWYTESCAVIRQLIPSRIIEFEQLYKGEGKRKKIDANAYNIQDWLNGVGAPIRNSSEKIFDDFSITFMRFQTQTKILESAEARFESTLFDIKQLLQADLFDSELDAANELLGHGFFRGAGAIAGVVLEKHLAQVCDNHNVKTRKKHPTISDFNDLLKKNSVLDTPTWRQIQRLGDIRNLCDHNKHREPTKEEIEELIRGVEKTTKTLF